MPDMGYIEPIRNKISLMHTQFQVLLVLHDKTVINGSIASRMLVMNMDTFCCLWVPDNYHEGLEHVV